VVLCLALPWLPQYIHGFTMTNPLENFVKESENLQSARNKLLTQIARRERKFRRLDNAGGNRNTGSLANIEEPWENYRDYVQHPNNNFQNQKNGEKFENKLRGILGINANRDHRAQIENYGANTDNSQARNTPNRNSQGRRKEYVDMDDDQAELQLITFLNEDDNQNKVQNSIPNYLNPIMNDAFPQYSKRSNFDRPNLKNYRPNYAEVSPQHQNFGGVEGEGGGDAYNRPIYAAPPPNPKRPNYASQHKNYNGPEYGALFNRNANQNFGMRLQGRNMNRINQNNRNRMKQNNKNRMKPNDKKNNSGSGVKSFNYNIINPDPKVKFDSNWNWNPQVNKYEKPPLYARQYPSNFNYQNFPKTGLEAQYFAYQNSGIQDDYFKQNNFQTGDSDAQSENLENNVEKEDSEEDASTDTENDRTVDFSPIEHSLLEHEYDTIEEGDKNSLEKVEEAGVDYSDDEEKEQTLLSLKHKLGSHLQAKTEKSGNK